MHVSLDGAKESLLLNHDGMLRRFCRVDADQIEWPLLQVLCCDCFSKW